MDINLVTNKWRNYKKSNEPKPSDALPSVYNKNPKFQLKRKDTSLQIEKTARNKENTETGGKGNWRKVFAFSKFISLAKSQSEQEPANLVIGGRWKILFIGNCIRYNLSIKVYLLLIALKLS